MAVKIDGPTVIPAAGTPPKRIEEYIGLVNSRTAEVSIARMQSPAGWQEPGQRPAFTEYTLVLQGMLQVETRSEVLAIHAGEAVVAQAGEWVRYSTPEGGGADYVAVCLPAFSPDTVRRDQDGQGCWDVANSETARPGKTRPHGVR